MKKILNSLKGLLLALVVAFGVGCAANSSEGKSGSDNSAELLDLIMTRASVRHYTDQPVEKEKVDLLLRAGMASPTGRNLQPWAFVVVDDSELIAEIAEESSILGRAPLGIVVCGDMSKQPDDPEHHYWIMDCSAATENILLAAHALDLGAVWLTLYPMERKLEKFREFLSLPDHLVPLSLISIGYPTGPAEVKDKWNPDNVFYNSWKE